MRIIPAHHTARVRQAHAAYAEAGRPVGVRLAAEAAQALLATGLSAETLRDQAGPLADALAMLARLPPELRARLGPPELLLILAEIDAVPPDLRRYGIRSGDFRSQIIREHGLDVDLPELLRAALAAPAQQAEAERLAAESARRIAADGLVDDETLRARLGLDPLEFRELARFSSGRRWHPGAVKLPDGRWLWRGDLTLSAAERAALADRALLTRHQAAEWLGVSPGQFDRLKQRAGVAAAGSYPTASGYPGKLYRLSDLRRLKQTHSEHQ